MIIQETELTEPILNELIALSEDWEKEFCCHDYRKNTPEDLKGNRIFLALEDGSVIGYLLGRIKEHEITTHLYEKGTKYFEVEELYVKPAFRSQGVGKKLFRCAEKAAADEVDLIMVYTDTRDHRAILHFYMEELGMEFWCARLFKKLR